MRYLVTGGAGFIGSHLVDALLLRGEEVTAVDSLATGRLSNLDNAGPQPGFRFVHGSVLDEPLVDELVHGTDVVVHLAAAVGVKLIVEQPLRSFTTNIRGSEVVIEAAHRYRRKILVASTSEVYGKNDSGPLAEDDDRVLGSTKVSRWAYATAKAVDEILAQLYHAERGLPAVTVRLFNTVGTRQSPAYGMVIPRLVRQAVAGEPLTVFGDGEQTRCFCHVSDCVRALLALLDEPGAVGRVFNVGAAEEVSISALAERIRQLAAKMTPAASLASVVRIPYDEAYRPGFEDMRRRVPDTARLRALTGWTPTLALDEILVEAIAEAIAEAAADAVSIEHGPVPAASD